MSGEKERLRAPKTRDRKKETDTGESAKKSKKLNHVTLPWGVDPVDDKKRRRDSLAKSPPPYRKDEQNVPDNTLPFDINTLYPDEVSVEMEKEEKPSAPPKEQAADNTEDSVIVEEVTEDSVPSEPHDSPLSKTMPMHEPDKEIAPELEEMSDSLEQRLKALGESEDRAKLKFIIAISSVVLVGLAVVLTVLFVTADGKNSDSASGRTASNAVEPPTRAGVSKPATGEVPGTVHTEIKLKNGKPREVKAARSERATTASEPRKTAKTKPQPKAKVDRPAKKAKASEQGKDTVLIRIGGVPRHGDVYINDKRAKRPYRVPKSDKAVKIEVRAPGYASVKKRVVPNRDKVVSVHMKRQ